MVCFRTSSLLHSVHVCTSTRFVSRRKARLPVACPPPPHHTLLLQVVPTDYHDLRGRSTFSNQFSVTENFRESSDPHVGGRSLPGVFFFYDLSPIKVRVLGGVGHHLCWGRVLLRWQRPVVLAGYTLMCFLPVC